MMFRLIVGTYLLKERRRKKYGERCLFWYSNVRTRLRESSPGFLCFFQIRQFSGAVVTTKGHFMAEIEKGGAGYGIEVKPVACHISSTANVLKYFVLLTFRQRPLYLHVQGKNQEQVNSKSGFVLLRSSPRAGSLFLWGDGDCGSRHVKIFICAIRGCDED